MIIYKTTNLIDNKIYIGKSFKNDPKYFGSGIHIKNAIRKYGIENFRKEILEICINEKDLNEKEIYWIDFYKSRNKEIGYNIAKGGNGGHNYGNIEVSEKISKSVKNKPKNWNKESKILWINKLKQSLLGKNVGKRSKETCEKMSKNRKGIKRKRTCKVKLSEAVINNMKIRFSGEKNPMYRRNHKEESKKKMSFSAKNRVYVKENHKFKSYYFYYDNKEMYIAYGQKEALDFCRKNNLSSILIKKELKYKEWKCKIIKPVTTI